VLRIFIALKSPSPWPGSNPQSLGPVVSTLTTTPPRRLVTYGSLSFSSELCKLSYVDRVAGTFASWAPAAFTLKINSCCRGKR
jgi:hypothetical protein